MTILDRGILPSSMLYMYRHLHITYSPLPLLPNKITKFFFQNEKAIIYDQDLQPVITASKQSGNYIIYAYPARHAELKLALTAIVTCDPETWHKRLGHISYTKLEDIKQHVEGFETSKVNTNTVCIGCLKGKQHRDPFTLSQTTTNQPLELVHSDICGPLPVPTHLGFRYFVTFLDDYTHWISVFLLKQKSDLLTAFRGYLSNFVNPSGHKIGTIRTDNGGEYKSSELTNLLLNLGIRHEFSAPYTPQQNGSAERLNRTLMETCRSQLLSTDLSLVFWGEALLHSAYVLNRRPTRALHPPETPYSRLYGQKPNISHLRIFGCEAHALVPSQLRNKLSSHSVTCRFSRIC